MNTHNNNNIQIPSPSIKCRFFSQYQFSNVCFEGIRNSVWNTEVCCVRGYFINNGDKGKIFMKDTSPLELKPLSKISNEDAKEIILLENFIGVFEEILIEDTFLQLLIDIKKGTCNRFLVIDFLRSKGYAIPFMQYSVDDLISFGWVKLI